jgi:hypothetical protein
MSIMLVLLFLKTYLHHSFSETMFQETVLRDCEWLYGVRVWLAPGVSEKRRFLGGYRTRIPEGTCSIPTLGGEGRPRAQTLREH